ncbi:MAG TPA: ATPase, partial [Bacillota bacterium]
MGRWGLAKRVFAGSNSAYGFYSFYEGLLDGDWRRVFIIKGGPGTGKSTLMRHIAEDLLASGYDIEFLHCSADNESIDGFLAPALGVVMVDG